jgi:hypothetical protein
LEKGNIVPDYAKIRDKKINLLRVAELLFKCHMMGLQKLHKFIGNEASEPLTKNDVKFYVQFFHIIFNLTDIDRKFNDVGVA